MATKPKTTPTPTAQKPNFGSLLSTRRDTIEKPKPMPEGTYLVVVQGLPRQDKSSKKGTDFVEFTYKFLQAGEDVDTEALDAIGGLDGKTIKDTYYLTDNSLWRLEEMLQSCGVEGEDLAAAINETPNSQLLITIGHEPSQDGRSIFARVKGTASAAEE